MKKRGRVKIRIGGEPICATVNDGPRVLLQGWELCSVRPEGTSVKLLLEDGGELYYENADVGRIEPAPSYRVCLVDKEFNQMTPWRTVVNRKAEWVGTDALHNGTCTGYLLLDVLTRTITLRDLTLPVAIGHSPGDTLMLEVFDPLELG